ncbi:hypothetical protein QBC39DRAFT_73108 [Podospora conica]|nr:hypothetical protein QBC39DRAFT_73108 [Schizothecium conicum]
MSWSLPIPFLGSSEKTFFGPWHARGRFLSGQQALGYGCLKIQNHIRKAHRIFSDLTSKTPINSTTTTTEETPLTHPRHRPENTIDSSSPIYQSVILNTRAQPQNQPVKTLPQINPSHHDNKLAVRHGESRNRNQTPSPQKRVWTPPRHHKTSRQALCVLVQAGLASQLSSRSRCPMPACCGRSVSFLGCIPVSFDFFLSLSLSFSWQRCCWFVRHDRIGDRPCGRTAMPPAGSHAARCPGRRAKPGRLPAPPSDASRSEAVAAISSKPGLVCLSI